MSNRYFTVDVGASYTVIATSAEHAEHILDDAGCDWNCDAAYWDDPPRFIEMSPEFAARVTVDDSGGPTRQAKAPLTSFKIGDWFCSEY